MKLFPQNFTKKLSSRARSALNHAINSSLDSVRPIDLLYAITLEKGSLARNLLESRGVSPKAVKRRSFETEPQTKIAARSPVLSGDLKRVLTRSVAIAAEHESVYIGTEHFLLSIIEEGTLSNIVEKKADEVALEFKREIGNLLKSGARFPNLPLALGELIENSTPGYSKKESKKGGGAGLKRSATKKERVGALEYFGEDITEKAARSELDPLVGREKEVERALSILSRRTKNNPILIGEAGVGKTAIVHGLAQRFHNRAVPEHLVARRIIALDLGLLVAGTVFRGEFESRLKDVIHEAMEERAVLFIDEIHTVVGAGSAQGALDAANMLKPAISTGELQIIGATTTEEYRRSIEKDPALNRRFQPIQVEEPSVEETVAILKGLAPRLENYHRVRLTDEVIEKATRLAGRFLHERKFPDKAIDVLDEAAAQLRSKKTISPENERVFQFKELLADTKKAKELAIASGKYDEALRHKNEEDRIQNELSSIRREARNGEEATTNIALTTFEIESVVSRMAGVSLERISEPERDRFKKLGRLIRRHIVGQDEAVSALVAALTRARSGIKDDRRPVGSFLFLGPSGVGKTELARVLAQTWFEDPSRILKIDMSEFSESHTVAKFLGSPPGYIGYDDGGTILEVVRRRPALVVLFDEIEKAHSGVQNLLLQILEDGGITDARGTRVNFEHAVIILTSNIGQNRFFKKRVLGFGGREKNRTGGRAAVFDDLRKRLKPELVSRIDKIIVFKPLGKNEIEKIVERNLNYLKKRLKERGWTINFEKSAVQHLAEHSQSSRYGARKVRSTVRQLVEDVLAQKIVSGELEGIKKVLLSATKGSLKWDLLKR